MVHFVAGPTCNPTIEKEHRLAVGNVDFFYLPIPALLNTIHSAYTIYVVTENGETIFKVI